MMNPARKEVLSSLRIEPEGPVKTSLNSVVYRGTRCGKEVAVKFYFKKLLNLYHKEIWSLEHCSYPFTQELIDYGIDHESGEPFLVTSWIDGAALSTIKKELTQMQRAVVKKAKDNFLSYLKRSQLKAYDFAERNILVKQTSGTLSISDIVFIDLSLQQMEIPCM